MSNARPLVFDEILKVRCTKTDKEDARVVAERLDCADSSDALRRIIRWLANADDYIVHAVKTRLN